MSWQIGSEVVVRPLGNKRGVVVDASRNGRYKVLVEGITMSCGEEDLAAPAEPQGKKKRSASRPRLEPPRTRGSDAAVPAARVDLHGLVVEDAMARALDEIDRALRRGADRLEVMHGKGSGRVRDALHKLLARLPAVKAFRLDARNPGVTWVYF